jgi:hypothetical protein
LIIRDFIRLMHSQFLLIGKPIRVSEAISNKRKKAVRLPCYSYGKKGPMAWCHRPQFLRGYECAGRRRTFSNLDPGWDGIKICSAQILKTLPVIRALSAKPMRKDIPKSRRFSRL